jgi:hypothetical protein
MAYYSYRYNSTSRHPRDWRYREQADDLGGAAARTMIAKYTGKCIVTGERINPGDEIRYEKGVGSTLVKRNTTPPADGRYISDVLRIGGKEFYRNKRGTCEDAPCCGCCTI